MIPMCQVVGRRKRQRTDGLTDRSKRNAGTPKRGQDNLLTRRTKTKKKDRNDLEQEICVITWNVNTSSAQYDFFCVTWLNVKPM